MTISDAALLALIRIVPAQRIAFAITPNLLVVQVAFIRCHDDDDARRVQPSHRFQYVYGPLNVDGKSFRRRPVAFANERLCCQVQHDFRLSGQQAGFQLWEIADVGFVMSIQTRPHPRSFETIGLRNGRQGIAGHGAPSRLSQRVSQLPLKPVWPVTKTRRLCKASYRNPGMTIGSICCFRETARTLLQSRF